MSSSRQSHYDTSSQQTVCPVLSSTASSRSLSENTLLQDGAADSSASKRKRGPPIKFSESIFLV
ncbi:hypothetical protein B9479_007524 [Cryptococcus floricola]|uniref:Uncharacterized protein n=1 Tax=Cryptococcus floricola TaxID=2591691 RepID=A0A5D3AM72_9TREE|nr:hypothetical protein B9479_007524 [Cryptococcus floricola]